MGTHGVFNCGYELRLAAGTVDSYVGQLRAQFNSAGRTQPWRWGSSAENPCFSLRVKRYLKWVKLEQAEAHVIPRQAVPLFSDKMAWLVQQITSRLSAEGKDSGTIFAQRYIYFRDLAFFLCMWWAGDRAGEEEPRHAR